MTVAYPPRISLARLPTPLEPLDRLSAELGGTRIWVKRDDLTGAAISGNKIRKLEFSIAQALAEGADTLITCGGVQSNHCRATAIAAARLGLRTHLVLAGEPPAGDAEGNLFLDRLVGAEVSYVTINSFSELAGIQAQIAERHAQEGRRPFIIPLGASDEVGLWGYVGMMEELARDCAEAGIRPGAVVLPTGSAGTQAGMIAGAALFGPDAPVIGLSVSGSEADNLAKIRDFLARWKARYGQSIDVSSLPVEVLDTHIGPGYGKAEKPVFDTITKVARSEGLILDPVYTGKAFHGMLKEVAGGRLAGMSDVIFLHTGGIFGLMAQRPGFGFVEARG